MKVQYAKFTRYAFIHYSGVIAKYSQSFFSLSRHPLDKKLRSRVFSSTKKTILLNSSALC